MTKETNVKLTAAAEKTLLAVLETMKAQPWNVVLPAVAEVFKGQATTVEKAKEFSDKLFADAKGVTTQKHVVTLALCLGDKAGPIAVAIAKAKEDKTVSGSWYKLGVHVATKLDNGDAADKVLKGLPAAFPPKAAYVAAHNGLVSASEALERALKAFKDVCAKENRTEGLETFEALAAEFSNFRELMPAKIDNDAKPIKVKADKEAA